MGVSVLVIALVVALVLSLGSGGPLDLRSQGVRQELAAAVAHYAKAPVLHVTGGFSRDGHPYRVDVTIGKSGDSQGTVVAGGTKVEYRSTGGHTYVLAGQDYWASDGPLAAYLAGKWVAGSDTVTDLTTDSMRQSLALLDLVRPGVTFTRRGRATHVNGVPAEPLSDRNGDLYVSTAGPTRFLRMVSSRGYRTADGIADVRVDLDYPASLSVQAPGPVVDRDDPSTLPARYGVVADSFTFGACSAATGCTVSAAVRNNRGPQVGSPTAVFQLTRADGGDLGSCTAAIRPISYNGTETVSCTVSGPAWTAFTHVGGRYQGTVTVRNPFYDG